MLNTKCYLTTNHFICIHLIYNNKYVNIVLFFTVTYTIYYIIYFFKIKKKYFSLKKT